MLTNRKVVTLFQALYNTVSVAYSSRQRRLERQPSFVFASAQLWSGRTPPDSSFSPESTATV